jgi:hypothetical protein
VAVLGRVERIKDGRGVQRWGEPVGFADLRAKAERAQFCGGVTQVVQFSLVPGNVLGAGPDERQGVRVNERPVLFSGAAPSLLAERRGRLLLLREHGHQRRSGGAADFLALDDRHIVVIVPEMVGATRPDDAAPDDDDATLSVGLRHARP